MANRLLLFAPNLHGGGAERVLARLANHWAGQGRSVTLLTLAEPTADDVPLAPSVHRVGLGLTTHSSGAVAAAWNNVRRVIAVRKTIRIARPEVVVGFIEQTNVIALLAAAGLRFDQTDGALPPGALPVVVAERTDPARHPIPRLWDRLRRWTYPRATAIVVLTDEIAERLRPVAGRGPVVVIPNGVRRPPGVAPGSEREPIVLGVGRLDRAKGFDRLVEAFEGLTERYPQWRLVIVGEGPERAALETDAEDFRHRVELPGRSDDVSAWYARASLFALPSRYEGFPNALLEAMAHGLPAVAFDGPAAVRQVVRHGVDGLLVPQDDVAAFREALAVLMGRPDKREALGEAAREVATRFGEAAFFDRWDSVVDHAASGEFR